jgi:hypothetical protein
MAPDLPPWNRLQLARLHRCMGEYDRVRAIGSREMLTFCPLHSKQQVLAIPFLRCVLYRRPYTSPSAHLTRRLSQHGSLSGYSSHVDSITVSYATATPDLCIDKRFQLSPTCSLYRSGSCTVLMCVLLVYFFRLYSSFPPHCSCLRPHTSASKRSPFTMKSVLLTFCPFSGP